MQSAYASSFLGVFPSDLLPQHSIALSGTLIVNGHRHRDWFALVSRSFPITLPLLLLFRFIRSATIYSLHTVVHLPQLLCMELQIGITAGAYYDGLRQILLSLRPVHGQMLYTETILRSTCYSDRRRAGFRNFRVGVWVSTHMSWGGQCSNGRYNR